MQIHQIRKAQLAAVAMAGFIGVFSANAEASQEFPEALQEAAGMACAPSCVVCHGVDPGTADTFTRKKLGATLFAYNGNPVAAHDTKALKANYAAYIASGTPEALNVKAKLAEGIDPETGVGLCGPTYGCGAHVASKAPPRNDWSAALWVVGAVVTGGLLRRRAWRKR
ncbi:MAG TPA: hypothetical protein VEQ59_03185 [Polyangiaceae bacterium]|nr:hypothetical protein [Polyangiaceae bacterium]